MGQPRAATETTTISRGAGQDEPMMRVAVNDTPPSHLYTFTAEQLDQAVAALESQIGRLYERLTVVMVDYDQGNTEVAMMVEKERPHDAGQVIENLRQVTDRLFQMAATVDTIHRRLVLPGD